MTRGLFRSTSLNLVKMFLCINKILTEPKMFSAAINYLTNHFNNVLFTCLNPLLFKVHILIWTSI